MRTPPFCPQRECYAHWPQNIPGDRRRWWCNAGRYRCARAGSVQRFRCAYCGHRFSESTFSLHYYAKRRVNLARLLGLFVNSVGVRAASRQLGVSTGAVGLRIATLARQGLAHHAGATDDISVGEPLVADGLESFWVSQYYPNQFNLLVGAHSQFIYAITAATIRRRGRMRPAQRVRRGELERRDRPEPDERRRRFAELIVEAARLWARSAPALRLLITDYDTSYPAAVAAVGLTDIRHWRVSSKRPRTRGNPLFAVNYIDREMRKDLAEHRRETPCFARSAARSLLRAWLYAAYHNYCKLYRIGVGCTHTHAQHAGVVQHSPQPTRARWLTRRAFLSHCALSPAMLRAWLGAQHTPLRQDFINERLTPRYATQ